LVVQIIQKSKLTGTARHVRNETYETYRFLLSTDGVGVTITDIVLAPGIEATYGYDDHIEMAYCIKGDAILTDIATGTAHPIKPGTMWIARRGETFRFLAMQPTRLICVFNPAFEGHETGFAKGEGTAKTKAP
jgi:L-ectoine synthase